MIQKPRRWIGGVLAMLAVVGLVSCAHTPMTDKHEAGDVQVTDIDLGRSMDSTDVKITDSTHDFKTAETVFATVRANNKGQADATLTVRWLMGANTVKEETATATPGERKYPFRLATPAPGEYTLQVMVNGTMIDKATFDVKAS